MGAPSISGSVWGGQDRLREHHLTAEYDYGGGGGEGGGSVHCWPIQPVVGEGGGGGMGAFTASWKCFTHSLSGGGCSVHRN